ncbi:MAG: hypothetical protein R2932_20955 [Caldilineaceae bacterium]
MAPFVELATVVYVLVDEWYQAYGVHLLKDSRNRVSVIAKVLTLLLLMDFIAVSGRHGTGFIRANYLSLFPELSDQSHSTARGRNLRLLLEALRRYWAEALHLTTSRATCWIRSGASGIHKRGKRHSDFSGSATYGYCASRNLHYFGYKLVTLSTLDGGLSSELVPAHTDEKEWRLKPYFGMFTTAIFSVTKGSSGTWQAVQYDNREIASGP